jgi:poly-gamma-glutamate capsule biosynthesis protein CapA/YwtB (metallophosphatase superfamily)
VSNRRRNFRRKGLNIFEKENKHFKIISIILLIVLAIVLAVFSYKSYLSYKQKKQVANEQQESKNQIESIFRSADDAVNSANNYKTNTILRFSIAGLIDPNGVEKYEINNGYDFFNDIANYLNNSDFTIANYKIGQNRNEKIEDVVKQTGINVLNITNNSDEKIDNLYSAINDKGIQTIGNKYEKEDNKIEKDDKIEKDNKTGEDDKTKEGKENTKSERVNVVNKKGVNVAFIGYTANDDKSRNYFTEEKAKADLEYAKKNASVIIVMMDWKNSNDEATNEQKKQAKFLADNGANLIIGNNQNNIQTMEIIKGENDKDCFVAYSLGNLLSTTSIEKNKTGIILEIQILVDKDNNTSLNSVDYVSTYILKDNKQMKVMNLKDAVSNYEKENINISSTNYAKMKSALERVKKLINNGNK